MTNISSFGSGDLIPQEEKLELKKQAKSLFIGVPKEITFQKSIVASKDLEKGKMIEFSDLSFKKPGISFAE